MMQSRFNQHDAEYLDVPYRGEIKEILNKMSPSSLFVVRKVIDGIVENSLRKVTENENRMVYIKSNIPQINLKEKLI